jgi:hypothetical protein
MPTFRLTAPHYIQDQLLQEGTLVGDGTGFPIPAPSLDMVGVDAESQALIDKFNDEVRLRNADSMLVQPNARRPVDITTGQAIPAFTGTGSHAGPEVLPNDAARIAAENQQASEQAVPSAQAGPSLNIGAPK